MLRFSLESHIAGSFHCTDGTRWGHTWISSLGVERMMHGVEALWPYLSAADHRLLRQMLISESDWLLDHYHDLTMAALIGLMAGSLRALWPWQPWESHERALLWPGPGDPVVSVLLLTAAGFTFVALLTWMGARRVAEAGGGS